VCGRRARDRTRRGQVTGFHHGMPYDGLVSPRGHRTLKGVSDLLMLYATMSVDGVWTVPCTKKGFRRVMGATFGTVHEAAKVVDS